MFDSFHVYKVSDASTDLMSLWIMVSHRYQRACSNTSEFEIEVPILALAAASLSGNSVVISLDAKVLYNMSFIFHVACIFLGDKATNII